MAVLPVWRSPMINSRWPRPIGIMASMALMPVCSGSFTGCRSTTPGARRSIGLNCVVCDGPFVVDGHAQRIDHAADQGFAHGHGHDAAGAPHFVAFLDLRGLAQQHRAHLVFFQVHGDARDVMRELDQLAGHHLLEAVDAGDTVAHRDHRSGFGDVDRSLIILDLLTEESGYFICSNLSHSNLILIRGFIPRPGAYRAPVIGPARSRRKRWSRCGPPSRRAVHGLPRSAYALSCR